MKTAALVTGGRHLPAIAADVASQWGRERCCGAASRCLGSAPGSQGFDALDFFPRSKHRPWWLRMYRSVFYLQPSTLLKKREKNREECGSVIQLCISSDQIVKVKLCSALVGEKHVSSPLFFSPLQWASCASERFVRLASLNAGVVHRGRQLNWLLWIKDASD